MSDLNIDKKYAKCGEIFAEDGRLILNCVICKCFYEDLEAFAFHVKTSDCDIFKPVTREIEEGNIPDQENNTSITEDCCIDNGKQNEDEDDLFEVLYSCDVIVTDEQETEPEYKPVNEEPSTDQCEKLVNSKPAESKHTLQCPTCNKTFTGPSGLTNHLIIHSNERSYKCDMCNRAFKMSYHLETHKKMHSRVKRYASQNGEKLYQCDMCSKTYLKLSSLRHHQKRHSNIRDHECKICSQKFFSNWELKAHEICHTEEKPFQCNICSKFFARKKCMQSHLKIHSDVKEYVCKLCDKAFAQRKSLVYHNMKEHRTPESNEI